MRGLYIHIPFCKSLCPYCHFYSIDDSNIELQIRYVDALINEMQSLENKHFHTIYIGGGTPSALNISVLEKLLYAVDSNISYGGYEFSIEANPESVSDDFVSLIKESQISRVSLGVQSLYDDVLKLLGRIHSSHQAIMAADKILNINKDLNMDIIYDIPYTDNKKSIKTLEKIIKINPSHISAYSYDAEDTGYLKGFNNDDTLFLEVEELCEKNGFYKYETSNFAKIGKESIHNSLYWQGEEYIGLGVSAHSMVYLEKNSRKRYNHGNNIESYIASPNNVENVEIIASRKRIINKGRCMVKSNRKGKPWFRMGFLFITIIFTVTVLSEAVIAGCAGDCMTCHPKLIGDITHMPLKTCIQCHEPVQNKALEQAKGGCGDRCFQCHASWPRDGYHAPLDNCLDCHEK